MIIGDNIALTIQDDTETDAMGLSLGLITLLVYDNDNRRIQFLGNTDNGSILGIMPKPDRL